MAVDDVQPLAAITGCAPNTLLISELAGRPDQYILGLKQPNNSNLRFPYLRASSLDQDELGPGPCKSREHESRRSLGAAPWAFFRGLASLGGQSEAAADTAVGISG
jgi:hypothetical protein